MHLFIFGLGYSSLAIAREAMRCGFRVSGTTRSQKKVDSIKAEGIYSQLFGDELPSGITHILSSIPTDGPDILPSIPKEVCWLGYLSTTGVYGDWNGGWVDETSELRGRGERLQRRIEAEKKWLKAGGHVFRLAGIYGPGRSVIEDLMGGTARRIDKPGQVFSRIHVADIAQVMVASMMHPNPGSVYNVCDDVPAPAHEVVAYAAGFLGVELPPLVPLKEALLSPMGKEFYASNRRVKNDKIKQELEVQLRFPSYHEGVLDCLAQHLQKA